ncbi:MAG: histidinol dehydrogenase [Helicobacter sp.]|nr:histidinol dehydrogenase [Helicobacter sp.]
MDMFATTESDFEQKFAKLLARGAMDMASVAPAVRALLDDVRTHGDAAVLEHITRFDLWNPRSVDDIFVAPSAMQHAYETLAPALKEALNLAYKRIFAFHEKQKPQSWLDFEPTGTMLGQRALPVERAGLYIPGGKASYPSSLLMNAIPARVAGVSDIIVCSPTPHNQINNVLLAAAHLCGVQKFCKVGGASAIGLLAYGSASVPKVDVITGPGNIFVATAKKFVFGEVNVDMIAGPSEIGIIADESADPHALALDMLSQAEHDELASAILITPDSALASAVSAAIEAELATLLRQKIARESIDKRGAIIVTRSLDEAMSLMNQIAPEHLEIVTREPFALLPFVQNAGAVFLGAYTPEPLGDYLAGPNHTLPTGGSARFFSPLSVEHFMKKTSILAFSKQGACELADACAALAESEGLGAHARSILHRKNLDKNLDKKLDEKESHGF